MCGLVCGLALSWRSRKRTGRIFLSGRTLLTRCFNYINVCIFRSQLNVAPLSKNSYDKFPSLSQKTESIKLPAAVRIFNFFYCDDCSCHSTDCLFVNGSQWWRRLSWLVIILDRKASPTFSVPEKFVHKSFSGCCVFEGEHFRPPFCAKFSWPFENLPNKFLMMTIPACFPIPVAAHNSLRDVVVIPNQHNFCLDPIVSDLVGRPLQGLSTVPVSPLLKWRAQRLNELMFMTSSSYNLLRRLWISIGLESAIRNSVSTPWLLRTPTTSVTLSAAVLNARDWLGRRWFWWSWTVSLSSGWNKNTYPVKTFTRQM